jgi:hypothetical protein
MGVKGRIIGVSIIRGSIVGIEWRKYGIFFSLRDQFPLTSPEGFSNDSSFRRRSSTLVGKLSLAVAGAKKL